MVRGSKSSFGVASRLRDEVESDCGCLVHLGGETGRLGLRRDDGDWAREARHLRDGWGRDTAARVGRMLLCIHALVFMSPVACAVEKEKSGCTGK